MKLNGPISYPINGYNRDRQGFLLLTNNPDAIAYENSIGQNPMNQSNYGAFSLLHLIGDESNNVQTDGYRSWMRNGLLFSNNFDAGFIGVRKMNLTTGDDVSDFVINWNDNYGTSPGTGTPDNLIFSFTSGEDSLDVNHLTGRSYYGREVMRLTTNGNIGMGPEFNNNNQPKVELHIHTEDSTESYLQFSDELTGSAYTDGFRMGIPSTTSTNMPGIISSLRGVSYYWTQTNPIYSFDTTEHIGFIAQEVDTVDSRLTYMDSDSLLHVDYNKVVPILTEAIQELATINSSQDSIINSLNDRLTLLENCINNLNLCNGETFSMNQTNSKPINNSMKVELSNSSTIVLNQNVPNPFAEQTTITMELPLEIKIAQILFHNNEGRLIQSVEIQDRGFSELTVYANDLSTGVYTYTLVTDGKIIASKKMIRQ